MAAEGNTWRIIINMEQNINKVTESKDSVIEFDQQPNKVQNTNRMKILVSFKDIFHVPPSSEFKCI